MKTAVSKSFSLIAIIIALCSTTIKAQTTTTQNGLTFELNNSTKTATVTGYTDKTIKEIIIPDAIIDNGINYSVISIKECAFDHNDIITSVTIPETVSEIGEYTFYRCKSLTKVNIPNNVTIINQATFSDCTSLQNIEIPNSVISIRPGAFFGCASLKSIALPKSIQRIELSAFYKCSGLTNIHIPENVNFIGTSAFPSNTIKSITVDNRNKTYDSRENCNAIIETASNKLIIGSNYSSIPKSITALGDAAFMECSELKVITLPENLTHIGGSALYGCSGLTEINSLNPIPPTFGPYNFTITTNQYETLPIFVPYGSLNAYQKADEWKNFKNIHERQFGNVDKIENQRIKITTTNGIIHITGANVKAVEVIDINGKIIYKGNETKIKAPNGIYIIHVDNTVKRIIMQ